MSDNPRTAYHETGHAVIGYRFHFYGGPISIVRDESKSTNGHAVQEGRWIDGSTDEEQAVAYFAGFAAEKTFDPKADPRGSSSDNEQAAELIAPDDERRVRDRAQAMVAENWQAIQAVATALLEDKTLPEDEWSIIVDAIDEGED